MECVRGPVARERETERTRATPGQFVCEGEWSERDRGRARGAESKRESEFDVAL